MAVVSQPDRPRGRGRRSSPSPLSELALAEGLTLLRPERVGDPELLKTLGQLMPDLGVVVAFGQFLPKKLRELPSRGYLINAHASLLPRFRGAAPIAHAILAGEEKTGISVMRVEREMDAGSVALTRETAIGPDEDCGALSERLAQLAAEAIEEVVSSISAGTVTFKEQDHSRAILAPKVEREDARIDWRESSERVVRRVRAMAPRPGAVTSYSGKLLRILSARSLPGPTSRPPGWVSRDGDPALRIATGDGWLIPLRLQRAGGRPMDVDAFLRGRPLPEGVLLGDDSGTDTLDEG